jgi:hypothetical protein
VHPTTRNGLLISGGILAVLACLAGIGSCVGTDVEPDPNPIRVVNSPRPSPTFTSPTPTFTAVVSSPAPSASPTTAAPPPATSVPEPVEPADIRDRYYANCTAAREAGAAPLRRGRDDGYRPALDRDKDGTACD